MKKIQTDVVILGAGLTGLTLAYYLQKAGMKVLLIEKKSQVGGVIQTVREQGFTFEAGPNTGVVSSAELVSLFQDLQVEFELPGVVSNTRWIWKKNYWQALPSGFCSALFTPLFTFSDKIRVLGEPFRKRINQPNETIASLVKRRLGKSFLQYAVDPFISGIYAGDPHQLVVRFALPKLYALEKEYGSFVRGAFRRRKIIAAEKAAGITKAVFSVKGGLHNLIRAMVKEIGETQILTGAKDVQVKPVEGTYVCTCTINEEACEIASQKLISTVDGLSVASLFPFIPEVEQSKIADMRYAKVIQVVVGYQSWKGIPIGAFGGLVPTQEKKDILGILFPSALFQQRAPEGGALLSVFMGGIRRPDLFLKTDEELTDIVLDNVKTMMRCADEPELIRIFRYEKAIPQYESTTEQRLLAIRKIEKEYPGLILAGNMRDGIGMSDRVKQAKQIVDKILTDSVTIS